jgi:hypothetical protein
VSDVEGAIVLNVEIYGVSCVLGCVACIGEEEPMMRRKYRLWGHVGRAPSVVELIVRDGGAVVALSSDGLCAKELVGVGHLEWNMGVLLAPHFP